MLHLLTPTSRDWVQCAVAHIDDILLDHVHCEKKAAATAISLINRYPSHRLLVERMAELAIEEMDHFRRAIALAHQRGLTLPRDHGDEYVNKLLAHARKQDPARLLDHLLIASLIEARSCERFMLLLEEQLPEEIRALYAELAPTEAGHYTLFQSLAREYFAEADVKLRFEELRLAESEIVRSIAPSPAMHG